MTSTSFKCVVLEDEDDTRKWIIEKLNTFSEIQVIGEASSINNAFTLLAKEKPDVAFMDIRLIGGEAFQLLDRLKQNNLPIPYIICITGYPDYVMTALNDYRSNVLQYILKPFLENWEEKFRKAIDAIIAAKIKDTTTGIISEDDPADTYTFLNFEGGLIKFEFDKINYLEAGGGGNSIIVTDEKNYEVDYSLARLQSIFPSSFSKISRSNVVNIDKVQSINRGDRTVEVICHPKNMFITISDHYYSDFLKELP